jgi:hypothetical protein
MATGIYPSACAPIVGSANIEDALANRPIGTSVGFYGTFRSVRRDSYVDPNLGEPDTSWSSIGGPEQRLTKRRVNTKAPASQCGRSGERSPSFKMKR